MCLLIVCDCMTIETDVSAVTEMADKILVNSQFTRKIFKISFPSISQDPVVLYPSVKVESYNGPVDENDSSLRFLKKCAFFNEIL